MSPICPTIAIWLLAAASVLAQTTEGMLRLPPPDAAGPGLALPKMPAEASANEAADSTEAATLLADVIVEVAPPRWYQPSYWFDPQPWDVGIEFGLNGNEGINNSLSITSGAHIKRKTERWKIDSSLAYNRTTSNGVETQNNAQIDTRLDRKFQESAWSLYVLNQDLYDEFQAFDFRVALSAGVGYQFIETEILEFGGRVGAGSSREFGGIGDAWNYEALFGLDYEHKLSDTQRLSATLDYFPEWDNFKLYRIVTDAGWEIDLDRPKNLSLKFAVTDRYDSTPNGADPNELNYSVLLIWRL